MTTNQQIESLTRKQMLAICEAINWVVPRKATKYDLQWVIRANSDLPQVRQMILEYVK